MMKQIFKSLLFVVLVVPVGLGAMEEPDKIELGKQLVEAAALEDWKEFHRIYWDRISWYNLDIDLHQIDKYCGMTALMWTVLHRRQDEASMIIGWDSNLDFKRKKNGETALMIAAGFGRKEITQMLIHANANLHITNDEGITALGIAAQSDHLPTCFILLEAMLNQIQAQKERAYTTLNCLKQVPCGQYSNLRNIFMPYLREMINEPIRLALTEISQVTDDEMKRKLIDFVVAYDPRKKSESSKCTLL